MPPKKRDKDKDAETGKNSKTDASNDDHEQFLQAFEKPTQIYRYLRTRNMLKPVFLYRTLTYMRHRMSRSNKSRRTFKVDSLLQTVTSRLHQQEPISGFLTLTFLGFYNKSSGISQEEPVKVETLLLKICHKKRKDVSCPVMTVSLGTSYVPYNPSEEFPPPKAPTVSIPTESFSLSGHLVKSYHLLLRVATMTSNLLSINSDMDSEPAHKKRKSIKGCGGGGGGGAINGTGGGMSDEEKLVQFGTDLVIYDKQNRCLLSDGEYEFYLEEIHGNNSGSKIAHALSTWEEIGFDKELKEQHLSSFEKMSNGPTLKVRLQWSREPVTPMVDRPLPLVPVDKNDLSNKENNRPEGCSKLRDRPSVVYQFLYNNNSKQQTEASCDMHCPWCSIDCRTLYSLLKHLKLCHPRFSFTYVPTQSGARIDVSLNEGYDGSYSGAPSGGGGGARGAGPVRRTPLSHVIVCHPRRPHPALTEFLHMDENEFDAQRPYITGHNRLYHHTTTCLPIYPKEMDIDSEDETDPRWLQKKTMMMIDEFTDVNEGEKELMKMWNLHVMRHGFVGDCQIALACTMFLQQRAEQLLSKNLYRNFVLHMCNLFDFGLISPVTVYTTVQKLQEMIGVEDTKVLKESVLSQREAWKDGGKRQACCGGGQNQGSPAPGVSGAGTGALPGVGGGTDTGQRRKPGTTSVYSDHKKNQHNRRSPSPHHQGGEQGGGGVAKKRKLEPTPQQQHPAVRRRLSLPATSGRPELRRKQPPQPQPQTALRRRSSFTNLVSNPLPPPPPSDHHHPPSKKKAADSSAPPPPLHAPSPLAVNH